MTRGSPMPTRADTRRPQPGAGSTAARRHSGPGPRGRPRGRGPRLHLGRAPGRARAAAGPLRGRLLGGGRAEEELLGDLSAGGGAEAELQGRRDHRPTTGEHGRPGEAGTAHRRARPQRLPAPGRGSRGGAAARRGRVAQRPGRLRPHPRPLRERQRLPDGLRRGARRRGVESRQRGVHPQAPRAGPTAALLHAPPGPGGRGGRRGQRGGERERRGRPGGGASRRRGGLRGRGDGAGEPHRPDPPGPGRAGDLRCPSRAARSGAR